MNHTSEMRRPSRLGILIFLFAALSSSSAHGQVSTSLDRLDVALWPEYDQPGVLVMLHGWLPADAHLPTYVPLPIPLSATPSAVAERDDSGRLLNAAHTLTDHDSHREVRIAANRREVRVEYYAPLQITGDSRSFVFEWPGLLALDATTFELQHPSGATDVRTSPSATSTGIGFDGLTYSLGDLGSHPRGETFAIEISYQKSSPVLTLTTMERSTSELEQPLAVPPSREEEEAPASSGEGRPFPWFVLIPVLLIGGLIVGWFLHSSPNS